MCVQKHMCESSQFYRVFLNFFQKINTENPLGVCVLYHGQLVKYSRTSVALDRYLLNNVVLIIIHLSHYRLTLKNLLGQTKKRTLLLRMAQFTSVFTKKVVRSQPIMEFYFPLQSEIILHQHM